MRKTSRLGELFGIELNSPSKAEVVEAAGLSLSDEVIVQTVEGEIVIRSPEAAATAEVEADRATLLGLLAVGEPDLDQLLGTRIVLRWETPEALPDGYLGILKPGFITNHSHDLLWIKCGRGARSGPVSARNIVNATVVWTSLGKPEDAKPPRPDIHL